VTRAGVTLHGNFSSGLQILALTLRNASHRLPLVWFTPLAESLQLGAVFMGAIADNTGYKRKFARMATEYDHLSREALIELLKRRDSQTPYGLVWEKRGIAHDKSLNRDFVGLELDPDLSCGPAPWRNLVIEGDNYDALRHLVSTHAGQVKLIYIDPPYNTGRKDFVYNDSYFDSTNRYRHSTWLEFMYQRLRLAKDLLAEDGVIFVSIDDNELFNLGLLMNKVFGENNFIANVIWQKVFSPKNTAVHFSDDHEYVLVYAANRDVWRPNPMPRTAAQDGAYKNMDNDPRGSWMSSDISARNFYSAGSYSVTTPSGRVIDGPPPGRYWTVSEDKFHELDKDNRIWWGKKGDNAPRLKRFLSDVKQGVVPQTLWTYDAVGHTQDAKKQLNEILPKDRNEDVFSTPKPLQLMDRILRLATKPGDLVVDFFAGSGTLAQAVLQLNKEDGGERRFILVSSTEATADEPGKNLCRDVCATRVRRAAEGYTSAKGQQVEGLGGGFAYLRARHIPTHRLEERLDDGLVWSYIQMKHHHPLTERAALASVSVGNGQALIYLPSTTAKMKAALREALEQHPQAIVYTWTPAALVGMVNENNLREVPADLTRGFRFGNLGGEQA
jgi:adenine-specific DNA-methyltransferase